MHLKYEHRHSAHCESGVTSGLLSHHGLPLTEAMAFGIGSGLFFAYLPFLRLGSLPLTTFRSYPGQIFAKATSRLGVQVRRQRFRDPAAAMAALDELLDHGQPVGCQTGIYWLPYFPPGMRFHFNVHNIVVYGREGEEYLISDPVLENPVRCAREDLIRARFARGPMAPRGHLYFVARAEATADRRTAVLAGIRETCSVMSLPVSLFGYRGIRFLARRVAGWQERLGSRQATQHLGNLIRMQEEIGTGGGGFRFMFAKFLQEAAETLKEPRLEEFSARMTAIGDRWRDFALMASRNCKGRADETESYAVLAEVLLDCGNREREFFRDLRKLVGELRRSK